MRHATVLTLWLVAGLLATCGCTGTPTQGATGAASGPTSSDARPAAGDGAPRVFLLQPGKGATLTSPVRVRVGSENIRITAAASPEQRGGTVRPGVGHYHLAVDNSCPPAGTPMAAPWIHVNHEKPQIDLHLTMGPHRIALQVGDDAHVAIAGLCDAVDVMVQ